MNFNLHFQIFKKLFSTYYFHFLSTVGIFSAAFYFYFFGRQLMILTYALLLINFFLAFYLWKKKHKSIVLKAFTIFFITFCLFHLNYKDYQKFIKQVFLYKDSKVVGRVINNYGFSRKKYLLEIEVKKIKSRYKIQVISKKTKAQIVSKVKPKELNIGDLVEVSGNVLPTRFLKDNNYYKKYLIKNNIMAKIFVYNEDAIVILKKTKKSFWERKRWLIEIKKKLQRHINFPANEFSYAIITGDTNGVPKLIKENFKSTGTYHVLAVSGMHAGILIFLFYHLFRFFRLSKRKSLALSLFIIMPIYVLITGGKISIIRTYLMLILAYIVSGLERKVSPLVVFQLIFLLLILIKPNNVFSISFQLSFSAVFGILLMLVFFKIYQVRNRFIQLVLISFSAQLITAPFLNYYFGYTNYFSIVYNLFIPFMITLSLGVTIFLLICPIQYFNFIFGDFLTIINHSVFFILQETNIVLAHPGGNNYIGNLKICVLSIVSIGFIFYFFFHFASFRQSQVSKKIESDV